MQQMLRDVLVLDMKKMYEEISGKKILVEEGTFWTQKQRQGHSLHYIVPYQACFAPQIPQFFIERYSKQGDIVLDPFCGRGTTVFEANLAGRTGIGVDVSPLAITIAESKLNNVMFEQVEKRLKKIDFSKGDLEGFEQFKDIYHPKTYQQLRALQKQLKSTPIDILIKGVVLGRLHGHSPSFFSVWTFNVISLRAEQISAQSAKRNIKPEFRDVVPSILLKAKTVLEDPMIENEDSWVELADSRKLPIKSNTVDLIVTSPPFLDTINYLDDNWLRFWFLGYDREELRTKLVQTSNLQEYKDFMLASMKEMHRVLLPGKTCVIEVGDVNHKSKKLMLDHVIVELAGKAGFKVEKILIHHIDAPKISRAFSRRSNEGGTKTNRCVIMRKI